MTDKIREALFSSIGPQVDGADVLDLFAGSGSVGIEALSRGAAHVTFVEHDPRTVAVIRSNLEVTGFSNRARLEASDVEDFLALRATRSFDLVFVDPPFRVGFPSELLAGLVANGYLTGETTVVVRVSSRLGPVEPEDHLPIRSTRNYGDSTLIYMTVEEAS